MTLPLPRATGNDFAILFDLAVRISRKCQRTWSRSSGRWLIHPNKLATEGSFGYDRIVNPLGESLVIAVISADDNAGMRTSRFVRFDEVGPIMSKNSSGEACRTGQDLQPSLRQPWGQELNMPLDKDCRFEERLRASRRSNGAAVIRLSLRRFPHEDCPR
jgi:hypothetical protein